MPANLDRPDPRNAEPPESGFELFRHRNADHTQTRGWHGYYWARPDASGNYELRSVPTSLGEPPVHAGTAPREPFEKLYAKADRV